MIPVFAFSMHLQIIIAYFIINVIQSHVNITWVNYIDMSFSFVELVVPSIAAIVVAEKVKNESNKLTSQMVRLLYGARNIEAIMMVS